MTNQNQWTLLVYRVPSQPTRLRLAIWRRLQKMGVLYLQDAVCLMPARPDLAENLQYVAQAVEDMGGTCQLFTASTLLPNGETELVAGFRSLAEQRVAEIVKRLDVMETALAGADTLEEVERVEEDLKRERVAYLRLRKLAYFGLSLETETRLDARMEQLKNVLNERYRGEGK